MKCPYNNTVKFPDGAIVPCESNPFDECAPMCGQCQNDLEAPTSRQYTPGSGEYNDMMFGTED